MLSVFAEMLKVCRSKLFLAALACLLGVNLFCLWDTVSSREYTPKEYRAVWEGMEGRTEEEKLVFARVEMERIQEELQKAGMYDCAERKLYDNIISELEAANGYETYVTELGRKKDLIVGSVLFRDDEAFSTRSAKKAYEDYRNAAKPVVSTAPSEGVELLNLAVTDLLAACAGIFACVVLFVREREQGMIRLQWTLRHGRLKHLWYKLCALLLCSFGISVLFYGCNYLFASVSYGFGPPDRDIRMVEDYAHSVHGFSVGSWLVLNFLLKVVVLFVMLLLCSLCCTVFNGMVSVILSFSAILLVEFLLYTKIAATSVYSPLRYINLIAVFQNHEWLLLYKHINVFGHPVNYAVCAVVWFLVLFGIAVAGCVSGYFGYRKKLEHRSGRRRDGNKQKHRVRTGLFSLELWKAMVMQRMLPMILGLLLLQLLIYVRAPKQGISMEEYYYKSYISRLEGEVTEETKQHLEELYREAVDARSSMALEAYQRVYERYEYLVEHGGCFVYDTGFGILTGETQESKDALLTVKLMLVLLLFCATVFSYDPQKRMDGLLHSTVLGERAIPKQKYLICALFSIFAAIAVYLPDFLQVAGQYEVHGYSYPAVSLPWLFRYGEKISIGGYLVLLYVLRLMFCPVVVVFIMTVAERLRSFVYTFFTCGIVLLCIPILTMLNPAWKALAYPLYGSLGNPLLCGAWFGIPVYMLLITGAVMISLRERRRLWN